MIKRLKLSTKKIRLLLIWNAALVLQCTSCVSLPDRTSQVTSQSSSSGSTTIIASPVPGKKGLVYSPFTQEARKVDVRGVPSGSRFKDPYSGRFFIVP